MGDYGTFDGVDAIARFEEASHAQAGHTLHRMTNHVVHVEGDRATARTYVDAWIMSVDNASGINAIGFYDDELVRMAEGWRIARRAFTQVRLAVANA
jgi:SnoaL-like domain